MKDVCSVCGSPKPRVPWIIGFVFSVEDRVVAVAYNCDCGTTRSIPLREATQEEKDRALLATESRYASAG